MLLLRRYSPGTSATKRNAVLATKAAMLTCDFLSQVTCMSFFLMRLDQMNESTRQFSPLSPLQHRCTLSHHVTRRAGSTRPSCSPWSCCSALLSPPASRSGACVRHTLAKQIERHQLHAPQYIGFEQLFASANIRRSPAMNNKKRSHSTPVLSQTVAPLAFEPPLQSRAKDIATREHELDLFTSTFVQPGMSCTLAACDRRSCVAHCH